MDLSILKNSQIFKGLSENEIRLALTRLDGTEKKYQKGSLVFYAGTVTGMMGFVLEGSVTIENTDFRGNRTILSHVGKGQFFAETYGYLGDTPLLVDVTANEKCRILFLQICLLRGCTGCPEPWMIKLIMNLLTISTQKNLLLSSRSFQTAHRTIRSRVMSYLNSIAIQKDQTEFDIPFDRQQLADYLNVERTALSKELGKMKADGLISYHKNHFVLHTALE